MLHTARSRNDMDHTLFKMDAARPRPTPCSATLMALAQAMLSKARAERGTLIVAYTHGQPAQPSTFGHYLAAALEVLICGHRPAGRGAQGTGPLPDGRGGDHHHRLSDRPRTGSRELLGFAGPKRNSYGCIAAVDYITGLYSALKLPFLHLGRLVQDFQFWTAFEVGQLHVPGSLVQISSIMPQKRNPVADRAPAPPDERDLRPLRQRG